MNESHSSVALDVVNVAYLCSALGFHVHEELQNPKFDEKLDSISSKKVPTTAMQELLTLAFKLAQTGCIRTYATVNLQHLSFDIMECYMSYIRSECYCKCKFL